MKTEDIFVAIATAVQFTLQFNTMLYQQILKRLIVNKDKENTKDKDLNPKHESGL